jgi:hypothetical protein
MRLTNYLRDAFVRNVSNNIPVVKAPSLTLIQEMCYNLADPRLKIIYDDEKLREQLQKSWVYLEEIHGYIFSFGVDWEEFPAVINYREKLQKRRDAIDKLRRAAYGCKTLKELREALPDLTDYMPDENKPAKISVPMVVDVVKDLTAAGLTLGATNESPQ